jgi:hypothetical protein
LATKNTPLCLFAISLLCNDLIESTLNHVLKPLPYCIHHILVIFTGRVFVSFMIKLRSLDNLSWLAYQYNPLVQFILFVKKMQFYYLALSVLTMLDHAACIFLPVSPPHYFLFNFMYFPFFSFFLRSTLLASLEASKAI